MALPERRTAAILKQLNYLKIVEGFRGRSGGYILKRPLDKISLFDIYKWTSSSTDIAECVKEDGFCSKQAQAVCKILIAFKLLETKMETELNAIKLDSFL